MKRFTTILVVSGLCTVAANAQAIFGYSPEVSEGEYTPLESPTIIYNGADEENPAGEGIESMIFTPSGIVSESGETNGYEIGFNFPFAGKELKSFAVAGSGYIILGNDKFLVAPGNSGNFFTTEGISDAVGCIPQRGARGLENTTVSYSLTDEALVIQFENLGMMTSFWGDPTPFSMQACLGKDGSVNFIFDNFSVFDGSNLMLSCAVRQGDSYSCFGGTLDDEISVSHNRSDILTAPPTDKAGIILKLKAPVKCVTPAGQPTDLTLSSTSNEINASLKPVEGADNYLALYSTSADFNFVPTNGEYYATDDQLDDCTVAYYGTDTSFINVDLTGGTTYYYKVYALMAYGLEGPAYNIESPLCGSVTTLPSGPKASIKSAGLDSVTIDAEANDAGDDVVILYNTYCNRDSFGDTGLFVTPGKNAKTGDTLPLPDDYTPGLLGMPSPENAGIVAFIGKASNEIKIDGLDSSTGYFFAVYSRNNEGDYSSEVVYLDAATTIVAPYNGNSDNFPRYSMPQGWTTSEADAENRTFAFRDEAFVNFREGSVSQGTQIIQQRAQLTRGNADGMTAWMIPQTIDVNDRHILAKFDIALTESASRFDTHAYNDWAEGDKIEILVSSDNGENWECALSLTNNNKPEFTLDSETNLPEYTTIEADLNAYRNKTVTVKLQWTTFTTAGFGANMYVDRFSVTKGDFPEVPVVSVGDVTSESAVINWKSSQTDYELEYNADGDDEFSSVVVKGANSYRIEGLSPLTVYSVRVRGILDEDGYSEWSDPVEFKTADWPAVDAPTGLKSNVDNFETDKTVILSWTASDEMESFEVAYREAASTEWDYVTTSVPSVTIENLKANKKYIWKVRAYCSHNRVTDYSAQDSFSTPDDISGISEILKGNDFEIFTIDGLKVSKTDLNPGVYIVVSKSIVRKINVR